MLKNYLSEMKFLENLSVNNLYKLNQDFPKLIPAFDVRVIVEKYIEKSVIKISCRICKKVSFKNVYCSN